MSDATDLEPMPMPFEPRREEAIAKNAALGLTIAPESTVRWAGDMQVQISAAKAKLAEGKKSSGKLLADAIAQATGSNSALADAPSAPVVSPADFDFDNLAPSAKTAKSAPNSAAAAAANAAAADAFASLDDFVLGGGSKAPAPQAPPESRQVGATATDDFLGLDLAAAGSAPGPAASVPKKDAGKALKDLADFRARRKQTKQTNNTSSEEQS